uniref:Uncharacterized protein n=1 Tax=Picea glauca TaxID=3330 RepID=A0A117NJB6_PICGL|nr:hypothetical protein ABT39_MTgene1049 [Picea glauca]
MYATLLPLSHLVMGESSTLMGCSFMRISIKCCYP